MGFPGDIERLNKSIVEELKATHPNRPELEDGPPYPDPFETPEQRDDRLYETHGMTPLETGKMDDVTARYYERETYLQFAARGIMDLDKAYGYAQACEDYNRETLFQLGYGPE